MRVLRYVGFVDTDTIWTTVVTPDILFNDTKPHILSHVGAPIMDFWKDVIFTTNTFLQVFKLTFRQ